MAAKRTKVVAVDIDLATRRKLSAAAAALSELANGLIQGSDDPAVRALANRR